MIENCFLDGVAKAALYVAAGSNGVRIIKNHVTNTVGAGTGNGVAVLVDNASNVRRDMSSASGENECSDCDQ